ncbi:hypothetical protein [Silvibacterium dinghuense]|uniref:Uncharacterized protein n=1 Tax=Silvibacterium dinghuense TaxID=1560006 RepID=A0A4Q1S9H8_9BACT|nr:hypothetical protein [Silvibacterium dinghuense]RXS93700.1 hypothetical protein ESZ00_16740 [Silvibacterium dinghuense]GGH06955.1 hypothetical protein GCM10011586_23940 [Silvibacterium dinghuense]
MRALSTALLLALLSTAATAQNAAVHPYPRLSLEGDGHACSGYFKTTRTRLRWKSSFSTCDQPYRVSSHDHDVWTLELLPSTTTKQTSCPFQVITLEKSDPTYAGSGWNVTGYESFDQLKQTPPQPRLSCPMM